MRGQLFYKCACVCDLFQLNRFDFSHGGSDYSRHAQIDIISSKLLFYSAQRCLLKLDSICVVLQKYNTTSILNLLL